jgi:hypothetical protein
MEAHKKATLKEAGVIMSSQNLNLEQIVNQAKQLPPSARLQLVKEIIETIQLAPEPNRQRALVYGRFHGTPMSIDADFELAEWRPTGNAI